eukprot:gnl/TRDRNA2_/TRDRNA2_133266_c1_seq1.p1 gnl/TRDRNA2_/TRDRNA2_133266_c1~~gnl/TRDRNA2_/TRDRNA2_133266_c1_seq1.p1  ORF type:complete len:264 (+),score=61.40 gnl/TRDRNA2_/TRDRNA2_133266_c1_seq1:2-793(+)
MLAAHMAAAQGLSYPPMAGGFPGALPGMPSFPPMASPGLPPGPVVAPASPQGGSKKFTCKLEVGIENESEFRVGSRVIQIAREIWQDKSFQDSGGKTRLRGRGIGGPHEADEPLALCISCRDNGAFERAVQMAETQLRKVHNDYKAFCQQKGQPAPDIAMKIIKKGLNDRGNSNSAGLTDTALHTGYSGTDPDRGERPPNAPTDEEIERLIEERNEARKAANFKRADEVRNLLKSRGVVLMDDKGAKGNFKGSQVTKWRFWRD